MDYLGIDYGQTRIGLAIGDKQTRLAVPLAVVNSLAEVIAIIKKENIKTAVLGNPKTLAGSEGLMSEQAKKFAQELKVQAGIEVIMLDERLTTRASQSLAASFLKNQPKSRKKSAQPPAKDAVAAMLILQNYFDQLPAGA